MKRARVKAIDFKAGKPTRWQAYDTIDFDIGDASQRRMTDEGFMIVPANISRTGVQDYTARELGIEGTNRTVRLFRPADEVFKPESYGSFERQTLTNDHPSTTDGVTATNYKAVTSGDVHDVLPAGDGINLGANLYIKDANTIEMVVTYDKNQLSCGYSFFLDMTPGTTPDGQAYDGVMRDIEGNHVAIVWQARGGPGLRVADKKHNQEKRIMRTVTIDSTNVNFEDDNQGALVEAALKRAGDAIKAADAARDMAVTQAATKATADALALKTATDAAASAIQAATDAAAATKATLEAKIKDLEGKVVTDEQKIAMVQELTKAITDAKTIIGDSFDAKGLGVPAIHVAALDEVAKDAAKYPGVMAVLGGVKPSDAKPEIAKLAFDAAVAVRAAGVTGGDSRARNAAARAFAPGSKDAGGNAGGARVIDYNARARTNGGQASA